MTQEELKVILKKHVKWLNGDEDGERADLSGKVLSGLDLSHAILEGANLEFADLRGVKLDNADLAGANLRGVAFDESEQIRLGIYLEEPMIGYKKCQDNVIVTLEIARGAIVFSINNDQCRTNMAKVVDIDGGLSKATSIYDEYFTYHKGETVYPREFDCVYNSTWGSGIHFFRTKKEAKKYGN